MDATLKHFYGSTKYQNVIFMMLFNKNELRVENTKMFL